MRPPWSDADAKLLKGLRQAAGLSTEVLAKRLVLSVAQVRELEGDDEGRFYSDQIKSYAGQRLLAHLGHVPEVPAEPQPSPPPPPPPPAPAAAPAPAPSVAASADADPPVLRQAAANDPEPTPVSPATVADVPPAHEPAAAAARVATGAASPASSWRWLWILLVVAGFAYLLIQVLRGTSAPRAVVQELPVPAAPNAPAPAAAPEAAAAAPTAGGQQASSPPATGPAASAPAVSAPAPAAVTNASAAPAAPAAPAASASVSVPAAQAVATASAPAAPAPCSFGAPASMTVYQSPVASRPSAYVYFESRGELQVCVRDAQGKESSFDLRSGGTRNVPGTAPYTVRVSDWSQARVFFEGLQVRLEGQTLQGTVVLKPFEALPEPSSRAQ